MANYVSEPVFVADPYQSASASRARDYYAFDTHPAYFDALTFSTTGVTAGSLFSHGGAAKTASSAGAFFYDWYFRIHTTPAVLFLGNLLSTQTRNLVLWNATFASQTLQDVSYPNGQGMSVAEPVLAPFAMRALEYLTYQVSVDIDGPASINLDVLFLVGGVTYAVKVTGSRVIVWPFSPNWSTPLLETLEWRTAIERSRNADEQRVSLRETPRRTLQYGQLLKRKDSARARNLLHGWQGRLYAVPIWLDRARLSNSVSVGATSVSLQDASNRSFAVGSTLILYKDSENYEAAQVSGISGNLLSLQTPLTKNWAVNDKVYPLAVSELSSKPVSQTNETDHVSTLRTSWQFQPGSASANTPDSAPPVSYRSLEFRDRQPNWASPLEVSVSPDALLVDLGVGRFAYNYRSAIPDYLVRQRITALSRSQMIDLRAFFGRRRGRAVPVWMPSYFEDFRLAALWAAGSTVADFEDNGYALLLSDNQMRRDVQIVLRSGVKYLRRIAGSEILAGGLMRLTFDSALPVEVSPASVKVIRSVSLYRLAGDAVTITYQTDSVGEIEATFQAVRNA